MKPFLKWAGNKHAIMGRVKTLLPPGARLVEPFAGSCAVFLNTAYPRALLADRNADLIGLYRLLQKDAGFIAYASGLFAAENNRAEAYYSLRVEFNTTNEARRKAALFLYLNRHGYNGLCRYNASGGFNVPFGRYAKPYFPRAEMQAFHEKSEQAEFRVADFRKVMSEAKPGDVVYCDPPYVPLSRTANFTAYGAGGFGEAEQNALARMARQLAARGIPVIISNHDTEFTMNAYSGATFQHFDVQRFISSKGSKREKAKEVLALFKAA